MGTAHVFFCKGITPDTASSLIHACRCLIGEVDPQGALLWDHLSVAISSGGGDIGGAFAMFNELKGMKTRVTTHNAGAVDSAAIMPFMAGSRRSACAGSAFFFHELHWQFPAQGNLTMSSITDATKWLGRYEDLMAENIADRTALKKDEVLKLMRDGTSVRPEQALEWGLIHEIAELATPRGARTWQA